MIFDHTVHAEPRPGDTVSPCCGLTVPELPRADWLTRNPAEVTCGTLTQRDIDLLLGGPAEAPSVAAPASEQFLFELTHRVRATCRTRGRSDYRAPGISSRH